MFTTETLQQEIRRLKQEKDVCILAHAYQTHDILEVADYTGDSFGLSQQAAKARQKTVLMCGVRFMAETVKILSPEKTVLLSHPDAGCPMAEQMDLDQLVALKAQHPDSAVVAYINTTSALKTQCDVCVTSSSALRNIRAMPQKEILFLPDCNLGQWVAQQVPEKTFHFFQGGCPVHSQITAQEVAEAKAAHPEALLLVHPECRKEVTDLADYAGSTTGIMAYAKESDHKTFLIGTETSIVQHLQYDCPDKTFYPLSKGCICQNMRLTTLMDVYRCLLGLGGEEITLAEETRLGAKRAIDAMLAFG